MYWEKAILKLWPEAREIREDWERRTATFELFSANRSVEFLVPKNLQGFGNDVTISVTARGDDRYKDQGDLGVVVTVQLRDVLYPERPE